MRQYTEIEELEGVIDCSSYYYYYHYVIMIFNIYLIFNRWNPLTSILENVTVSFQFYSSNYVQV